MNLSHELTVSNRCLAQGPDSGSVQYVTITDACFHMRQTLCVHSWRAEYKLYSTYQLKCVMTWSSKII